MKINDLELFVEDLGNPNGEVIVFLNGVMASTNSWYAIMKPFVKLGYRIILHDFKGQLKSDKPACAYTFEEHAKETVQILKNLNIDKAHFVGTSYGGEVALNIGFRFPEIVKSLVIIDSVSETDQDMVNEINSWIDLCEKKDGYAFFWGMAKSIYGPKFMKENMAFLEQRAEATRHVDPSYLEGQIILYKTFNDDVYMTNRLNEIKAPTLIICGKDDILKPPKFSKIMQEQIEDSILVLLEDCGHVAIFEKSEEIIELIKNWIN
ncbi:alpha/beta fold hydrolase [Mariniplasma anaerobium]|uniref:Alpha/beta hydrolase n=1 Tax=Mariniplasma anaerobium TaxID=2735436 RepID=A0A7U9TII1_9MOLU|nr:alpha/beta hydrolase [Mariniplasma anaerobium]BCR36008.1 alpha/beta hydrolase [Mariniplasma anaerobium]